MITKSTPVQHELGLAADEDVRQLVEQFELEVSADQKATAMKVATKKRAKALHKKMSTSFSGKPGLDEWMASRGINSTL